MRYQKLIVLSGSIYLLFISSSIFAQRHFAQRYNDDAFSRGTGVLDVGLGIGDSYAYGNGNYTSTPNFIMSYDYGLMFVGPGTISIGGLLSYRGVFYNYTAPSGYYYNQSWLYYIIGVRSAYHWNFTRNRKWDPYFGIMLTYYGLHYNQSSNDPSNNNPANPYYSQSSVNYNSYLSPGFYIGARYLLGNKIGIWLELGYGYTDAALGICVKF